MPALGAVAGVLRGYRFTYANETRLQEAIAEALDIAGMDPVREVRLDARSRIDVLCGRIGVEVKVAGKADAVQRQVERYLATGLLDGIVVVTSKPGQFSSTDERVQVVCLAVNGL